MWSKTIRHMAVGCLVTLAACGGGSGGSGSGGGGSGSAASSSTQTQSSSASAVHVVSSQAEASRFLGQATFGPNQASITALTGSSLEAWLNAEFAKTQTPHLTLMNAIAAGGTTLVQNHFYASWWTQAATADDQLRQRMAFALSQIMVVSFDLNALDGEVLGIANYYDMLGRDAFGNFRTLLEDVTLNPMMGVWLAMLKNRDDDATTGRTVDENYAREVMQLFTIGLYKLNTDGSAVTSNGAPVSTYGNDDVTGLARALTGWSWGGPDKSTNRFFGAQGVAASDRSIIPMQTYPGYHSTASKSFLGTTTAGDNETDLKAALDTLFNHQNLGPFIGRQLIQRLVTSNPSAAYVGRVAAAFNNNGSGVRGDMKAVIRAILLDDEARDVGASYSTQPGFGRVREPVLRMANWIRAFEASPATGNGFYNIGNTDDPGAALGMTPMHSPTVFNFYRPGYVAPGSASGTAGLVAPELQITNETSVAGYLNYILAAVTGTIGPNGNHIQSAYTAELALADQPEQLVDHVTLLVNAGVMPSARRKIIVDAVTSVALPSTKTPVLRAAALANRVQVAVYLVMASTDYIVQK